MKTHTHVHTPLCVQTSLMKANFVSRRPDSLYINKQLPVCSWGVTLYLRSPTFIIPNLSHFVSSLYISSFHFISFCRYVPLSRSGISESHDRGCSGWIMKHIRTCGHRFTYTHAAQRWGREWGHSHMPVSYRAEQFRALFILFLCKSGQLIYIICKSINCNCNWIREHEYFL